MISETLKEQTHKLDLFYKGVTFQETSNGTKYWEIKARSSSVNNSTGVATLEETNGTFFSSGVPTLKFKAPSALWYINKKEIILTRPLGYDAKSEEKGVSFFKNINNSGPSYFELPTRYNGKGKGFCFKAENLTWNISSQKIVCENGLWIKKGEISGMAESLQADVSLEKIQIKGHPKVFISDTIPSQLEANEFEIDNPKNSLTAKNGVVLTANQIIVKTDTAVYNQENGMVDLAGNVNATISNSARYDVNKQLMFLAGNPKLTKGDSSLSGTEIIIDAKTRNFSVKGKSKIIIPEKELTRESL